MASEDEIKVICPECGYEIGTKDDGTRIRSHKISGEKCAGSDELVTPEGFDEEDPFDALESGQDDDPTTDDENDPDGMNEAQRVVQSAEADPKPEFTHTITVQRPCPYVHQTAWHLANAELVYMLAVQAGHVPTGPAEHRATDEAETHLRVSYSVPVK